MFGGQFDYHLPGATISMIPGVVVDNGTTLQYFSPFPNYQVIGDHQYSDELRITSDSEKPLKWMGGAYWYQQREYQYFSVNNTLIQNITQTSGNPQLWNQDKTLRRVRSGHLLRHRRLSGDGGSALFVELQGCQRVQLLRRRR